MTCGAAEGLAGHRGWRKETSYRSGEVVKFGGKLYKANSDIPHPPGGEWQGRTWVEVVTQRAQGVEYEEVKVPPSRCGRTRA